MENFIMRKEKTRRFNRGHFPVGTVAKVQVFKDREPIIATVTAVVCNGPDSWVIVTDRWNENIECYDSYHLSHVKEIIKRGEGKLVLKDGYGIGSVFETDLYRQSLGQEKFIYKPKNHYHGFSVGLLVQEVLGQMTPLEEDHIYDIDSIENEIKKRFGRSVKFCDDGYYYLLKSINKKKFKRHLRRIAAHFKCNRKRAQKVDDDIMNEIYTRDYEYDMIGD